MTTDVLWPNAITVRFQNGTERSFRSIYDTLDFLECEWPTPLIARQWLVAETH